MNILECAGELDDFLSGHGVDDFLEDRLRQRATERLLTIIGEGAKQLSDETRQAIPQPWEGISRFRDKGIRGYDTLSAAAVYRIATLSVPRLRRAIDAHLGRERSQHEP